MRKIFDSMDPASSAFYQRVFNTAMLNLYAFRRGYFDTLICETDDARVISRWRAAVPQIVRMVKLDQAKDKDGKGV